MIRKIVQINEELCDGCGLCVPACAEGAIQIINGKAKLVSDRLCDGLGACLGECPRGAISIIEREAEAFDESLVQKVLQNKRGPIEQQNFLSHRSAHASLHAGVSPLHSSQAAQTGGSCPGARVLQFGTPPADAVSKAASEEPGRQSQLRQWPVQLALVPPTAPYLQNAHILLAADCVPFAYADFHDRMLKGKALLVGCPKLDDVQWYIQKLAQIIAVAQPSSITVAYMEVPCCAGLVRAAQLAATGANSEVKIQPLMVTVSGQLAEEQR
ncbi:MAG: 4Fe-4S binding protein [Armatimonadota bacterium]